MYNEYRIIKGIQQNIDKIEWREPKQKENKYVKFRLEVVSGEKKNVDE